MNERESLVRQIDAINDVIRGNLKTAISGSMLIAIGLGLVGLPFIELGFNYFIDPVLKQYTPFSAVVGFVIRSVFYWIFFTQLASLFKQEMIQEKYVLLAKVFSFCTWFPLIPLAVGGLLGFIGYAELATPIVLVLIGSLYIFLGQFTPFLVYANGCFNVCLGLVGIIASSYSVPNLWAYLVATQGLSFVITGLLLQKEQRKQSIIIE